jgi:multiple sugar transport system ATP-binding protein
MATVRLDHLRKIYPNGHVAVADASFEAADGELLVLVGPSGCGKSTLLRMIAGLESISSGSLSIGDRMVNDVSPKDRDIAMVFQNYALYPHMTVAENLSFGLKLRGEPKESIAARVSEAATMLELDQLLDRRPAVLSGGQRQRVALGRALVRQPQVFLLDEPLSNLDAKLREQMRIELRDLLKRVGMTAIYVTHDQEEALMLSDRIALMNKGRIVEIGTPRGLYLEPTTEFGAGFLGAAEIIPVLGSNGRRVQTSLGELELDVEHPDLASVAIRPEAIVVRAQGEFRQSGANLVPGQIKGVVFSGRQQQLMLQLNGGPLVTALVEANRAFAADDAIQVELPSSRLMALKKEPT